MRAKAATQNIAPIRSSDSKELKARATNRTPTKEATERIVPMEATTEKLSNKTILLTRPTKTDA